MGYEQETSAFPGLRSGLLLNKEATSINVFKALSYVVAVANSGDILLLSFSGHGDYIPAVSRAKMRVPKSESHAWHLYDDILREEQLTPYFAKMRGVRIVVVADCCSSGFNDTHLLPQVSGLIGSELKLGSHYRDSAAKHLILYWLASSRPSQTSREEGDDGGCFTKALISVLDCRDNSSSLSNLPSLIYRELRRKCTLQTPNCTELGKFDACTSTGLAFKIDCIQ